MASVVGSIGGFQVMETLSVGHIWFDQFLVAVKLHVFCLLLLTFAEVRSWEKTLISKLCLGNRLWLACGQQSGEVPGTWWPEVGVRVGFVSNELFHLLLLPCAKCLILPLAHHQIRVNLLAIGFTFGSVYMSMPLSHFVPAYPSPSKQKLTHHCKAIILQ